MSKHGGQRLQTATFAINPLTLVPWHLSFPNRHFSFVILIIHLQDGLNPLLHMLHHRRPCSHRIPCLEALEDPEVFIESFLQDFHRSRHPAETLHQPPEPENFYRAVREKKPAAGGFPTFEDGHWEVLIVEAVLKSHREQKWVEVQ